MKTEIRWDGTNFLLRCPSWDKNVNKMDVVYIPSGIWQISPSDSNVDILRHTYSRKVFTPAALKRISSHQYTDKEIIPFPRSFDFKNQPMDKQWDALDLTYGKDNVALFMQMGTGKTFITINVAVARYLEGKINAILVFCPTAVKPVWEIEFEKHCPMGYNLHILESGKQHQANAFIQDDVPVLKVMIVGIEALSQGKAADTAISFVDNHKCMVGVDESSRIKNPKAGRTKKAINIGSFADYRVIMTGTSVTQGIHDLYSQFRFLDWKIMGEKSFYVFKNKYCIMGGYDDRQILGYVNQNELMNKISPHTIVITKEEMMDLPPKVYEPMYVDPNPSQKKALNELGDPFLMATEVDGHVLQVETILERMTRYQQIVGGHFPWKEDGKSQIMRFPGKNPKMTVMMEAIEELQDRDKVIIWARFIPEIEWIIEELESRWPDSVIPYYGATPKEERKLALLRFQDPNGPRFFVSNPAMGGMGLTLTRSSYTIYYSNTFSLEDRLQSEDRNHRKGQDANKVTYLDIMMKHNIDRAMVNALRHKKEIADWVQEELQSR